MTRSPVRRRARTVLSSAADHLALPTLPEAGADLKQYLADVEVSLMQQALQRTDGIVARSAELLGLRRTTLVEKIKKYGIDSDDA